MKFFSVVASTVCLAIVTSCFLQNVTDSKKINAKSEKNIDGIADDDPPDPERDKFIACMKPCRKEKGPLDCFMKCFANPHLDLLSKCYYECADVKFDYYKYVCLWSCTVTGETNSHKCLKETKEASEIKLPNGRDPKYYRKS